MVGEEVAEFRWFDAGGQCDGGRGVGFVFGGWVGGCRVRQEREAEQAACFVAAGGERIVGCIVGGRGGGVDGFFDGVVGACPCGFAGLGVWVWFAVVSDVEDGGYGFGVGFDAEECAP